MQKKRGAGLFGIGMGIVTAFVFVNPYEGWIPLDKLVFQLSGSRGDFPLGCSMSELLEFMLRMIPHMLVMTIWGIWLYRHFCTASIYVFSRCPDRMKWYRRMTAALLLRVCIFEFAFAVGAVLLSLVRFQVVFDIHGASVLALHLIIYILWVFSWTLLINLISLKLGSSPAFMIVMGMQAVCITALGMIGFMERQGSGMERLNRLLTLIPSSHTVLGWQSGRFFAAELTGGRFTVSVVSSLMFLILFCIVVTAAGGWMTVRHELLVEDIETGVI